jgi:hypothetical protein
MGNSSDEEDELEEEKSNKKDKITSEQGLGITETIKKYGYGYHQPGLIDFISLDFIDPEIGHQFPHPSRAFRNLKARGFDRRRRTDLIQDIDLICGRAKAEEDNGVRKMLLDWLVVKLI